VCQCNEAIPSFILAGGVMKYEPTVVRRSAGEIAWRVFWAKRGRKTCAKHCLAAPCWAQLPIDPQLAKLCDDGDLEQYDSPLIAGFGKAFVDATSKRGRQA